jgi:hypothetical protein
MVITLVELMDRLASLEETYLVELLGIQSADIVEHFQDLIEERYEELCSELQEISDDEDVQP